MRIVYIADDDTEFSTLKECEEYEAEQRGIYNSVNKDCRFFNDKGKQVIISENLAFDNIFYVEINTNDAAERLERYLHDMECLSLFTESKLPCAAGRYYYNYDDDKWHHVEEIYQKWLLFQRIFGEE